MLRQALSRVATILLTSAIVVAIPRTAAAQSYLFQTFGYP